MSISTNCIISIFFSSFNCSIWRLRSIPFSSRRLASSCTCTGVFFTARRLSIRVLTFALLYSVAFETPEASATVLKLIVLFLRLSSSIAVLAFVSASCRHLLSKKCIRTRAIITLILMHSMSATGPAGKDLSIQYIFHTTSVFDNCLQASRIRVVISYACSYRHNHRQR